MARYTKLVKLNMRLKSSDSTSYTLSKMHENNKHNNKWGGGVAGFGC